MPVAPEIFDATRTRSMGMNGGTWHAKTAEGKEVASATSRRSRRHAVGRGAREDRRLQDALYFAFAYPAPSANHPEGADHVPDILARAGADAAAASAFKMLCDIGGFVYFKSGADGG